VAGEPDPEEPEEDSEVVRPSREAAGRSSACEEDEEPLDFEEEPEEEEPLDFEPDDFEPEEPDEDEPEDFEPEEDMLPLPWGPPVPPELEPEEPEPEEPEDFDEPALAPALAPTPAPTEPDEERLAPRLTALELPDSRSDEVLGGGEAWLAGVFFADPDEDEELLDAPSPPLLRDLERGPPSTTMASAESANPRTASPPRKALTDLIGKRARNSADEPSRSIAVGSSVVVRASMACLPASGPTS